MERVEPGGIEQTREGGHSRHVEVGVVLGAPAQADLIAQLVRAAQRLELLFGVEELIV